jgi:hypothetical protein
LVEPLFKINALYERFVETYLSGLTSYKALGIEQEDGSIISFISFYTSRDDACWYITEIKSNDDRDDMRKLIESAIAYNEGTGRFKFYSLCDKDDADFIDIVFNIRYDYVDECIVPAKTRCIYNNYWQILYNRMLPSNDTIVRCSFLKAKHRKLVPIGGNI